MKRKNVISLVLAVLLLIGLLTACNGSAKVQGKYFKENSDGTLDDSSWIELLKGGKWIDDEGASGKYVIKDNTIDFYIDEIPDEVFLDGTIENGIITIEFAGSIIYRKEAQGSSTVDTKASVNSITGGKVEGLAVSLDVSNTIDNVDLSGMITVSSGSSWQLYEDITGQKIIPTKYAANLKNGDNTYYIVVNSDDDKINRTYTLTIHKRYYVTITYNSNGSTYISEEILTHTTLGDGPSITRDGYTFGGWDSKGHYYVTASKTFTAKWTANKYTATLIANGGSVGESSKIITMGSTFSFPTAYGKKGYSFDGWYTRASGGKKLTDNSGRSISNWFIAENTTVYAQWKVNQYSVTLNKNYSEAGTVSGQGNKNYDSSVTITAQSNSGYTWLGWYEGVTKVSTGDSLSYTFNMPASNKTYEARWRKNIGTVSFNPNGGQGEMDNIELSTGDNIPFNAFTKESLYFAGWSQTSEGDIVYSNQVPFVVIEDGVSYTLYAQWSPYIRLGNYILFGEYPQTIKANDVTITETTDSRGYYLGSDGYSYAKVTATPSYESEYTFSSNATVTSGTVYYFKVEPIKWRILEESDGTALILCESIIANKQYHSSSNNYMNSEIKAWLNSEFYNTAFTALQQELIEVTNVDNSVYSTGYSSNSYACANTNDKIFLPSYRDMVNPAFGFNSNSSNYDTARRRLTSDYSRATGAYMVTSTEYYGNGWWWLRSPCIGYSDIARYIWHNGYADGNYNVDFTDCGVVPALVINMA